MCILLNILVHYFVFVFIIFGLEIAATALAFSYKDEGCMEEIEYWFSKNMYVLGVVALTLAVIQISTMVTAVVLFCCLRRDKYLL
ncbi:hypothetical protein KUTeg_023407 [Tegillarca granosa]|uniref:Uncharacterized protein n=1 Tax=Tegillarca granosa TaxID=220873 RepID=A0ABQ9E243_TEGGR|nr:hypothetical protein KUTeg_023407 [Tegillarca granosa]